VQEIVEFGSVHGVGLECGSKPELQAVLGITESVNHIIVCNGYKDEEYMRLALMGQKLGHTVFVVIEQLSEVDTFLKVADELGISPTMGVRIKLATEGSGRWAKSGGEKSKFGLSAMELMKVLEKLEGAGRKDVLRLVHFHLGSQITDIQYIKAGLEEIGRFYVELRKMGFALTHVDVGGGLGVDYDGSRSTRPASMNYSMREYANDVVYTLGGVCKAAGVPMPHLISESGRAITAHHSLLLINVTDVESQSDPVVPDLGKAPHPLLLELRENLESISAERLEEVHHDATFGKERAQELFASGVLTLRDRANAEQLYLATMNQLARLVEPEKGEHPEIWSDLESTLVDRYFCNFSVFQSLPDNWAGAYQEILGDLHNLFGDTNAVHVRLTDAGYEITDMVHGDTVTEVLNYVQFQPADLLTTFRRKVTNAKDLPRSDANQFIADYVAGLEGYTYLEGEELPGT